ncbi:MAG: S-adenosylhomocysteine deaminase [Deltaproteobacteria bacterium]|nr:MAG: S-adenosylhomocysteine deaminase [Deltaproteobacteria bacterium]
MTGADILVHNGTILTMDSQNKIISNGILAISGNKISYIGKDEKGSIKAKKKLDTQGGLILPGLINSHTHAAMSLFRGLADDLPLMEWLNNYIFPVEGKMDADFVRVGTLLACAEMIMSGTTTFCDMYLFEEEVARAAKEAGMRSVVGEVIYDFPSPNYGILEKGFIYTEALIERWKKDPLVNIAVEPHSLFTCGKELLIKANDLALRRDVPLILHLSETKEEVEEIEKRFGKRPVQHLKDLGLLGSHLIVDHCVHINKSEIKLLAENDVCVVHNPESNMKLASGIAPIPEMIAKGITVGLGTDGCASNNNLDLFGEMDIAAKLHKVNNLDPTVMDAQTLIKMATIDGAKVLGLETITGSLEVGKSADLIVIDTNKPHLIPMYNPYSHLVYAASGHDVKHSIIDGRIVMEDRRLLTLDVEEIIERSREKSKKVKEWVKIS